MKNQRISLRLETELLQDLTYEYYINELFLEMSFSEFIRQKLKKGEQK